MSASFQFTREQLKIIDLAIGWVLHGGSSLTTRPAISDRDLASLHSLGESLFSLSQSCDASIRVVEADDPATTKGLDVVPPGSLRLLILAVSIFLDELGRMDPEIEIVTGLPRARTEELLRFLETQRELGV